MRVRAAQRDRYGPPEVVELRDVERPVAPEGQWKPIHPPDVVRLKELIAAGQLRPVIERYPLHQVVEALRHVEDGRARGKVVITIDEPPS